MKIIDSVLTVFSNIDFPYLIKLSGYKENQNAQHKIGSLIFSTDLKLNIKF